MAIAPNQLNATSRMQSGQPLRQQNFLPNQVQTFGAQPQQAAPQQVVQNQGQVQQQVQPAFGLSGFEQAAQAGASAGVNAIGQGQQSALGTLQGANQFAQNQLQQGVNTLGGNFGAQAAQVDPLTGQPMFQQAAAGVNQFTGAGVSAQQRQAALSGALGNEAQQQAFTSFNESPGQAFLREQGLRQVTNAASATGGLVGGNVLSELQRQGQGLAQQDFSNQFNRLGQLTAQGQQAAGQAGQFLSQAGQQQGNLAAQNAQLGTQVNLANAGRGLQAAQGQAQLFGQGAGIGANLAGQGAGIQFGAGQNVANILGGAAQGIGDARFQTGRDLASQIGQSTSALSQLADRQGSGFSDIIGAGSNSLSNLLSDAGQLDAAQQTQLAQLLANISTGSGTQLSNIALGQGANASQAALSQGANQQQLLGNLAGVFGQVQGSSNPIFEP